MIVQVPGDRQVPWLRAPAACAPLKYACSLNPEALAEDTPDGYEISYVDIGSVDQDGNLQQPELILFSQSPSRARRKARSGDVIISTVRTYLTAIAHIQSAPSNLVCSTGFTVIRARASVVPRFLFYWLRSAQFVAAVVSRSVGVSYPAINPVDLAQLPFPGLGAGQQRVIADFLDRETVKIDDLIAKKERLLGRMAEYRFAVIVQAVTGGLPDLGTFWKHALLGRVIRLQRGFDITEARHGAGSVPVISSGGFSGVTERAMVNGPGVVVGRKGTLGTVHYVECDYWPHDTTLFVQDFRGSVPRFVYYFLRHLKLESYDVGAANPTLNRNHVHPLAVRWPDTESQVAIAKHLDEAMPRIDAAAQTVGAAVSKLCEYRTALISAAVTGQIDVRKHEKQLEALG
jgi:type I restriction enzyme S subunit